MRDTKHCIDIFNLVCRIYLLQKVFIKIENELTSLLSQEINYLGYSIRKILRMLGLVFAYRLQIIYKSVSSRS